MTGGRFADCRSSRLGLVSRLARVRATKEANLSATCQSAIQRAHYDGWPLLGYGSSGSVKRLRAIEEGVLGMHAGSHHSGRGQCGAGKNQAGAAIGWQTPAESSTIS